MQIVLAALALASGQPLTDASSASCIFEEFGPADRRELVRSMRANESGPVPAVRRLEALSHSCAEKLGWTPLQMGVNHVFATSSILRDESRALLEREGLSPALVDRWLSGRSHEARITLAVTEADLFDLMQALERQGVSRGALSRGGNLLGAYLGASTLLYRIEQGLAPR